MCRELIGALTKEAPPIPHDVRAANVDGSTNEGAPEEIGSAEGLGEVVDPRIGTVVAGKWVLEAFLGAGGMGRVYRARHRNGHRVAIKFLHPELAVREDVVRRFRREGYSANRVAHPAMVRVVDDGDDDGPFLVMDLLEGKSCRAIVRDHGPRSPEEALRIVEAVGEALAAAHRAGVVHRDVKPDNVFLLPDGDVRLLDFGLAAVRDPIAGDSITADGTTIGTVGYMSPEQARGENSAVGPASDVWSLAATCVALVAGRPVHRGRTPAEQLAFAVTKNVPPIRSFRLGFSRTIEGVLDRALSFDPAARPADAGAFVEELARARTYRRSRRRVDLGMLTAFAIVGALASIGAYTTMGAKRAVRDDTSSTLLPSASLASMDDSEAPGRHGPERKHDAMPPLSWLPPSDEPSPSIEHASKEAERGDDPTKALPHPTSRRQSSSLDRASPDATVVTPNASSRTERDPLLPRF